MPYKQHEVTSYHYSLTLSSNDYAAKMSLWNIDDTNNNKLIGNINFMYENLTEMPPNEFNEDQTFVQLYMPIVRLKDILHLLENAEPGLLTINPPFAFLSSK